MPTTISIISWFKSTALKSGSLALNPYPAIHLLSNLGQVAILSEPSFSPLETGANACIPEDIPVPVSCQDN